MSYYYVITCFIVLDFGHSLWCLGAIACRSSGEGGGCSGHRGFNVGRSWTGKLVSGFGCCLQVTQEVPKGLGVWGLVYCLGAWAFRTLALWV